MWISRREYERLCDAESTVDLLISQNKTLFERMGIYRCSAERWKKSYLKLTDITWKKEMTTMSTEYLTNGTAKVQYAPSNDEINNLDTEITKLRELLSTPNLTPETIEEANKNLQYLLALKRRPHMEVWTDGK